MSYEFKKLADVDALDEVPEVATVLAEVEGEIKRIPSSGLGGIVKTAIIKQSDYDDMVEFMATPQSNPTSVSPLNTDGDPTFSCLNMTFEEAYETMLAGEPLDAIVMLNPGDSPVVMHGMIVFCGVQMGGTPTIVIDMTSLALFWTADGIYDPNSGGDSGGNPV